MKRILVFIPLLAAAVGVSAWMGIMDSQSGADGAAQLNTSKRRQGLNDGEVLIWSPDMNTPPPTMQTQSVPAPRQSGAPAIRRRSTLAPTPAPSPQYQQAYAQQAPYQNTRSLVPIARQLKAPRAGEWRSQVREPEQPYSQFIADVRSHGGAMVVQPLGDLPVDQKQAIGHVLDAVSAFFGRHSVCAPAIPLDRLPRQCFRQLNGRRQINADAVMTRVLQPKVGGEVGSIIAITTMDMYPGDDWEFESAFGWSSFDRGTSVLSTHNILDRGKAGRGQNLLRLSKLTIHELCHTFGMKHCSTYSCLMNGCSDVHESDSKPLALCPDCLAKLSLATGREPGLHLEDMLGLCKAKGFNTDGRYYVKALQTLK